MRLHLIGLPHTETTARWSTCAYTQKVVKAGKMLSDGGHEVFLYSSEENEAVCAEHVTVVTATEREAWYGSYDPNGTWGNVTWDATHEPWRKMNERVANGIRERAEPYDIVLLSTGWPQLPIVQSLPNLICCEPFVGYEGIIGGGVFAAFESHAWRHHVYGLRGGRHDAENERRESPVPNPWRDGRWYDATIPNFFDPGDFHLGPKGDPPYLLYVGRLIARKGILTAADVARAAGLELVVAGPGAASYENRRLVSTDGCVLDDVTYVGPVGPEERAELMAGATALLAPTTYIEPFGGVAVEAMLSGTPVIATDWGAFTETLGDAGWLFRTLEEGVHGVDWALGMDAEEHAEIRRAALERFSLGAVRLQFTHWFRQLRGLYGEGWYATPHRATVKT